jgi:polyhydroxyalkanoate synthesis regulator phasin
MQTHERHLDQIVERLKRIEEALEQKPDRDDLENVSSDLAFTLEVLHDDVRDLQGELEEVKGQVDDLHSEDR